MIFAEIAYQEPYGELHDELVAHLGAHFSRVQSGLQGDSWIWIHDGEEQVAIDTFTAMKHRIKSPRAGPHVQNVLEVLALRYKLEIHDQPGLEGHEDAPR